MCRVRQDHRELELILDIDSLPVQLGMPNNWPSQTCKGNPQPARQPEAALRSINNVRARLEPSHRRRIFAEWTKFFHQS